MAAKLRPIHHLPVKILPQPDETTCGPTCLHAVYNYWGKNDPLEDLIARIRKVESGRGTFDVFLGCDALRNGFQVTIYTYNLMVFDPTWFVAGVDIAERLRQQREVKTDRRLHYVTEGYLEFLSLGGRLRLVDLSHSLIYGLLHCGLPILTGLSSTFLYRVAREYGPDDMPNDIRGFPIGHFVVIAGYNRTKRTLLVADPYGPTQEYWTNIDRVIGAILLGIVTYDSNLLVIHPPRTLEQQAIELP
ncbi:C39 family peptidase [Nitrosomonas sp. Is37]|uniref:C39 family peptidase n=1 Tax=Nitrosomonas sp. Is37 TaxID=3080535 RepID=UPI00294AEA6A|nr:C39 family peptidase [Nitrosomonas sp. Is37]MDV6345624.1 C39 family peptidase [Nitrosomonas sp. Is37]